MKFSFFQYRLLAPHSPGKKISWEEWFPEDALPAEYLLLPLDHFLQVFWVSREKPENGPVEGSPYLDPREPLNLEGQEAISRFLEIAAGVFNDENGVRYLERLHDGFREGMKRQSVGPILHRLFQQGILLHERVRQDTDYFRFAVSRESIFAELAVKLLGNTASLRVAALGEGEGLNRYLEALFQIGCRHFILSARAAQQYADFSDGENVTVYDQSSLLPMLVEADMVLAFPDAGQMLSGAMLKTVLGKRGPRPFLVLAGDKDELGALRSLKRIDDLYLFSPEELGRGIATNRRLRQEVAGEVQELLRQAAREFYHWMALEEHHRFAGILGSTPAMQQLFESMARIARSNITVLIDGESGTGKELVARAIHQLSNRADRPFEVINCGAIPENLLESELFGHVRGAFTGAIGHKKGLFEAAHHGTLLLDEIGELPAQLQVKLLRVLQEGEV
ncbi:MAG TPA: sigma 54-interacting transcriptional regulator, partial [Calditrichia bacterium]|nr:sigma 54-interacting transcriptional regulator [Calditrichia bacterium]